MKKICTICDICKSYGNKSDLGHQKHKGSRCQLTVLHSGSRVDLELPWVNRSTETLIVPPCVFSISVTFGVIYVLGGKVTTKTFFGDFESIPHAKQGQDEHGAGYWTADLTHSAVA